jgi:hypothetical protein
MIPPRAAREVLGRRKECHEPNMMSGGWRRITRKYATRHRNPAGFRAMAWARAMSRPRFRLAAINLSLRMVWRRTANFGKARGGCVRIAEDLAMSPDALNSLFSLCIGFALAGALASGYQALLQRPAGFGLLQEGVAPKTFAAVPFLVFAAPFIIMRNTLRGAKIERRRFEFVMVATVLAGFWSLMSGTFFVMTLRAAGLLA